MILWILPIIAMIMYLFCAINFIRFILVIKKEDTVRQLKGEPMRGLTIGTLFIFFLVFIIPILNIMFVFEEISKKMDVTFGIGKFLSKIFNYSIVK